MHPAIPYVFRAILAWINDENQTPYIVAVTDKTGIQIPPGAAKENYITLNIGSNAVRDFELNDEFLAFNARFAGVAQQVVIPLDAIHMVYALETPQPAFLEHRPCVLHLKESRPAARLQRILH